MRKIGLIAFVIILALAVMGVGIAKWSDSVTVEGTVETGTVKIGIHDAGVGDTGADPNYPPGDNCEQKDVASHISEDSGVLVCEKPIEGEPVVFVDKVTETITNAYPWYESSATLWMSNCGSIPVKIESIETVAYSDPDGLAPYIVFDSITVREYSAAAGWSSPSQLQGNLDAIAEFLLCRQIEPCHTLEAVFSFHFIEEIVAGQDIMPQNATLSFDWLVTASQWNEVPCPTPTSIPTATGE